MCFYHNNMLQHLRVNKGSHCYRLLSETVGVLVIFNSNFDALCILIESYNENLAVLDSEEQDAINISNYICNKLGIPFYFFKYSDKILNNNTQVLYFMNGMYSFDICSLYDFFTNKIINPNVNFNISNKNTPSKYINDKNSTPFHEWQRNCLNYNGFPVDIDMVFYENNVLYSLIEIKRSFVKDWKPYKADKNNYLALCKFCDRLEVNFSLFFIPQIKNLSVKVDDYDHISIYNVLHKVCNYKEADDIFFIRKPVFSLGEITAFKSDFFRETLNNTTWKKI